MLSRLQKLLGNMLQRVNGRNDEKHQGVGEELVNVRQDLSRAVSEQKRLEAECLKAKGNYNVELSAKLEESLKAQRTKSKELKNRLAELEFQFRDLDTQKLSSMKRDKDARLKSYGRKEPQIVRSLLIVLLVLVALYFAVLWFFSHYEVTIQ